ncbi:DUF2612 domain-containing protein [Serratia marcescens]|uniref:DUF2612 domain-containing protein n=1 Tax=Serratia marcescens TaxID=615 RepID=A0A9X8VM77_SERMA|nr:DUF2612 domain-containing protein [Serratia marcescens]MBS3894717.1 DUF2612 domain-containing protein [Serratia marcescens]
MTYEKTTQVQYSASPGINGIIASFEAAESLDGFTDEFLTHVWDIDTCGTFGLDIWGKIVGVSRTIRVDFEPDYFGFREARNPTTPNYSMPFNQAPFYRGEALSGVVRLENEPYRRLIKAKAFANITDATIPAINRFLTMLFRDQGKVYCTSGRDMTMSIVFEFVPSLSDVAIVQNPDVMPAPSGVSVSLIIDVKE